MKFGRKARPMFRYRRERIFPGIRLYAAIGYNFRIT